MLPLVFLALVTSVCACAVGDDPIAATVSFNAQEEMWRADAIVTEYDAGGEALRTFTQQHWETRTLSKNCVVHRVVYLPFSSVVFVYKQKIFPAVEGVYQIQEFFPHANRFNVVPCRAVRINERTVEVKDDGSMERSMTVIDPHHSFHEHVRMAHSTTTTIYTATARTQQSDTVVQARLAYERGALKQSTTDPLPAFIFRVPPS